MRIQGTGWIAAVAMVVGACAGDPRGDEPSTGSSSQQVISDELHNGGTPGFFFLPPVVPRPGALGDFVAGALPTVQIDEIDPSTATTIRAIATYSTTTGTGGETIRIHRKDDPAIDGDTDPEGYFVVRWRTGSFALAPSATYRIKVRSPAAELGFADVDLVMSNKEFKGVDRAEYVPLLDGHTLRIKFRIDRPAVDRDGDGSLDWVDNCPSAANADQLDTDGDQIGDACECTGVVCEASGACQLPGVCDAATGACVGAGPVADGLLCDDSDACTQTDVCIAGSCMGGNAVTCSSADQCHVAGVCDPATGGCSNPEAANGAPCSDADLCTQSDTCQAGACIGADPVTCQSLDQCHVAGTCDPSTGSCSDPAAGDGSSCDDANVCTTADVCSSGACAAGPTLSCDDGNPCTAEACDVTTGCYSAPLDGNSCDDGNASTQNDRCAAGSCAGVLPKSCRDVLSGGLSTGDGLYLVYPAGSPVQVYCDMTRDGGGWTLGVNIASDLGPIDLFSYSNAATQTPLASNYGLDMRQMGLSRSTSYRLGCVESSDSTTRKMFITGLDPAEPIFRATGTVTKTHVVCSQSADLSNPRSGTGCFYPAPSGVYDDNAHTYYGSPAWDTLWALYAAGSAYTLRHCAARGHGYFNRGAVWFR